MACTAKAVEQAEVATEPVCGVSGFKTVAYAGGRKEKAEGRSLGGDDTHCCRYEMFCSGPFSS